jgi:cytochrome c5
VRPATVAAAVAAAWLLATAAAQSPAPDAPTSVEQRPSVDLGAALPNDPVKPLVYARCDHCHGLQWIANSGGTEEGWTDRIRRMNRAGAMIPPEEIPVLAAYLAKALPERLRPPPPKRGASARRH